MFPWPIRIWRFCEKKTKTRFFSNFSFLFEIENLPDESSALSHKNHSRSYSIFKHHPPWSFHISDGHKEKWDDGRGGTGFFSEIKWKRKRNQGLTGGQQEQVDNEKDGADHAAAAGHHRATQPPDDFFSSSSSSFVSFFVLLQLGNNNRNKFLEQRKQKQKKVVQNWFSSSSNQSCPNSWKMFVALMIRSKTRRRWKKTTNSNQFLSGKRIWDFQIFGGEIFRLAG